MTPGFFMLFVAGLCLLGWFTKLDYVRCPGCSERVHPCELEDFRHECSACSEDALFLQEVLRDRGKV